MDKYIDYHALIILRISNMHYLYLYELLVVSISIMMCYYYYQCLISTNPSSQAVYA